MALDPGPINSDPTVRANTMKRLNVIAAIAVADALLLAVLLVASISNSEDLVHVLGPIHGAGFVALVGLCVHGAVQDRWDWWFPAIVVVTAGPPGSLIGDWVLRRKLSGSVAAGGTT